MFIRKRSTPILMCIAVMFLFGFDHHSDQPPQLSVKPIPKLTGSSELKLGNNKLFVQPAEIDKNFRANLGSAVLKPKRISVAAKKKSNLSCDFSCSAFVPRQAILDLKWKQQAVKKRVQGKTVMQAPKQRALRLDVTAIPNGFQVDNYGTVSLTEIPKLNTQFKNIKSNVIPLTAQPQVLLRMVEAGKVVNRLKDLPVFLSMNRLNQSVRNNTLSAPVMSAVQLDQQRGSIQQIRLMGQSQQLLTNTVENKVSLEGLQPGISYRFRLVEERQRGANTMDQKMCQVPVCAADFIDGSQ